MPHTLSALNVCLRIATMNHCGIINEKCELINTGALLADYPPVRHSHLFCTRWNELDKANGMVVNF